MPMSKQFRNKDTYLDQPQTKRMPMPARIDGPTTVVIYALDTPIIFDPDSSKFYETPFEFNQRTGLAA